MSPLEHLAEAERWAAWAKGCYETGVPEELPAARTCAAIGQLHVSAAAVAAQLIALGFLPLEAAAATAAEPAQGGGADG